MSSWEVHVPGLDVSRYADDIVLSWALALGNGTRRTELSVTVAISVGR